MKTLKSLLAVTVLSSLAITGFAQAENPIASLTYEDSLNMFAESTHQSSSPVGILSFGDAAHSNSVWSVEYEGYVDPADFQATEITSIDDINHYMGVNPTAAGKVKDREVFLYNDTAGEYHLQ